MVVGALAALAAAAVIGWWVGARAEPPSPSPRTSHPSSALVSQTRPAPNPAPARPRQPQPEDDLVEPRAPSAAEPDPRPQNPPVAAEKPVARPRLVEVQITSQPPGARVLVGSRVYGVTPLTAFMPPRTVTFTLELDGSLPARRRWKPSQRHLHANLVPQEEP